MSLTSWRILFVLVALTALGYPVAAAPLEKPSERQIARWIQELGNEDFSTRENASRQLWLAGEAAEAALEKALRSDDAEVVRRARALLDKFRWGIYPDTPDEVVALIRTYQSSSGSLRRQALEKLLRSDPAGLYAVLKFAEAEKDPSKRKELTDQVSLSLLAAFQRLPPGEWGRFDAFMVSAYDRHCVPNNHYATYWFLRGKLDEQIAYLRAQSAHHPKERRFAETLAYLYQAKGDWVAARMEVEDAKRADLVPGFLLGAADWKSLATHPDIMGGKSDLLKWAYQAAFARLAGRREQFERAVKELLRLADGKPNSYPTEQVARILLLNSRPDEALALLARHPDHQTQLFELLCARRQYREALALADRPRPADSNEQQHLNLLKARTLYQLGEKDQGRALFIRLGERIKEGVQGYWAERLLAEEYKTGLKDLAFEHCARVKSVQVDWGRNSPGWGEFVYLRQVFPDRTDSAKIWWDLLRQKFPDDSPAATLKRLRALLEGKTEVRTVRQWIEAVQRGELRARLEPGKQPTPAPPLHAGDPHWSALADAAHANGLHELADSLLEKADTPETLIRRGDWLAERKDWTRAVESYRQAWRKTWDRADPNTHEEHSDPLPLYLAGHALQQAGRHAEGDRLIEQSHWLLLGHETARYDFLHALEERGHLRDARREADLLGRVGTPISFPFPGAMRVLGIATKRKDPRKAAEYYELSMHRCFWWTTFYKEVGAYIWVPTQIHRLRAAGLLAGGNTQEARRHIDLALALNPGDVNVAVMLVPALERGGHNQEADTLFRRCLEPYETTCRDYPRCAMSHNNAAWIIACCRRTLDKALQHAEKAVELAPTDASALDTLAEVHFQRGDKDKAIALEKRAVELDPKNVNFRKRLRHLQSGDSSAEDDE